MKPRKFKSTSSPGTPPAATEARLASSDNLRRRIFRLAALFLPLAFFVIAELFLRLAGYGYPTALFLRSQAGGREVFINNPDFTRRFFPPGLSRSPEVFTFSVAKPADVTRVFVLGESAAMGDPEPAYGLSRMLRVLLDAHFPGRQFEVVNVAITAINSHVVREIARDCSGRQGDVWVIYMGNNEVVGPFGAGTVFGDQVPPRPLIHAQLALKRTRVGQAIEDLKWRLLKPGDAPRSWGGMEMFLRQQVRQDDPRMSPVYQNFAANLRDIVRLGLGTGARVVVSSVASNLKDCPPFASAHRSGLTAAQLAEWEQTTQTGATNEAAGRFTEALDFYERAARLDETHAELRFRIGRCLLALGRDDAARGAFVKARDLDTLRFRADGPINDAIVRVARELELSGVRFVDGAAAIAAASPHGLPSAEFLYEHVHFNFAGTYRLARAVAESIAATLGGTPGSGPWLTEAGCAQHLAFTAFDRSLILEEMVKRLELPPFSNQLDHTQRLAGLRAQLATARDAARTGTTNDLEIYRAAIAQSPEDWILRGRFGEWLTQHGDAAGAADQWRKVIEFAPHSPAAWYQLATALDAQGKSAEAIAAFEEAARRQPESALALVGLGLALANAGRTTEAQAKFEEALRRQPDSAEARINLAQLIAQQGRAAEAEAMYRAVLSDSSNNAAANINLGKMLAARKDFAAAIAHYQAALRANPDSAVAHYNLGNALTATASTEALGHYAEAARLKPDFAEARFNLGLMMAKQGRSAEALVQFAEAARLKPDFAEGRLNHGVALARAGRFREAAGEFEATLKLQPDNVSARKFLEQARERQ